MVRETILCLVQLIVLYGTYQPHARLPQYVFRADFCPYTNDSSQWKDASNRLHCLHDLNSSDTGNVYQCLPSSFLNETVEFCGKAITVPPGFCPIYNYTNKADDVPGLYNCKAFISRCPTESFLSKDIRKFPSCLIINRKHGCYEEERHCPKTSVTPSIPTDSSPEIPIPDDHDKAIYVAIIVFEACVIIGVIIISLRYRYRYLQLKERTTLPAGEAKGHYIKKDNFGDVLKGNSSQELMPFMPEHDTDQNIPNITTTKCNASYQTEDQNNPNITTNCNESCHTEVVSDLVMTKNILPELNDFTEFLKRIEVRITGDTWHSMKIHLREFVDHKRVEKMNPSKMLKELSDMLKLQYNMSFLEWIFGKCGNPELVKDCQQYSAENQFQLECFNTNFTPSGESQPFEIQFTVVELESYRDELQDLRYWLAKTIRVHPGQILMTALKNGPIVVTFLMKENHGNAILEYLKTDDGQIAASHKRIAKIVQNGNVIEIGKALNGSNFVQIRIRLREYISGIRESVRNLASIIFRRTGLTMEGNEIYTRTVLPDRKRNVSETEAEPIKEESFIEKNRDLILENIEPLTFVEHTDIANLFDRGDLEYMKNIIGRRDQAKYVLKLCNMLPNEKREKACAHLEEMVLRKEKSTHEEPSLVKKLERIQRNREVLLDEIDSEFIKSTIYQLEDAPEEVKTSWSDPHKSRKERAEIFLDFALQKDEYVKALMKTVEENRIQFPE